MKKILFKALMLAAVLVCFASTAHAELANDERELLDYLQITEQDEDLSVQATRADMAKMVANAMTKEDVSTIIDSSYTIADVDEYSEYYPYVAYLYQMGVLDGYGNGEFYPDNPVEPAHAAKMAVKMLRVPTSVYSESYYTTALAYGISIKSENGYMTKENLAEMIYEILFEDLVIPEEDETLSYLERIFGLYEIKGIVEADDETSIFGKTPVSKGCYKINNTTYINETEKDGLIGKNVKAYYKPVKGDYGKVVCISEYSNNELKIDALKLRDYKNKTYEYVVDDYDSNPRKARLDNAYTVLYNGEFVDAGDGFTASDMEPTSGSIELIDNDNDEYYEIVKITKYKNERLVSVDTVLNKLYTKSSTYQYDPENVTVYDADGNEITISSIAKDTILSIARNFDETKTKIITSTNTITGKLSKTAKDYVLIDDALYYYDLADVSGGALPNVGATALFYLNFENKIIDFKIVNADGWMYAYLCNIYQKPYMDEIYFRLFTEQGYVKDFVAKDRFTIDGDIDAHTYSEAVAAVTKGSTFKNIVRVEVNADGQLYSIDTLNPDIVTSDTELIKMPSSGSQEYRKATGLIGCDAITDKSTKVFSIPDPDDTSTMEVLTLDQISSTTARAYSIYTSGADNFYAGALVMTDVSHVNVDDREQRLTVVEEILEIVNADGEPAYKLVLSSDKGQKLEMDTVDKAVLDGLATPIEAGDLIKYGYTSDNKINKVELWYDYRTDGTKWKPNGGGTTGASIGAYRFDTVAYIYDIQDSYLKLQVGAGNDPATVSIDKKYISISKANIFMINKADGTVQKVSAGELKSYKGNGEDYETVFSSEYEMVYSMYIYR